MTLTIPRLFLQDHHKIDIYGLFMLANADFVLSGYIFMKVPLKMSFDLTYRVIAGPNF